MLITHLHGWLHVPVQPGSLVTLLLPQRSASHRSSLPPGVLYYGDTAGNNVKASQYVTDLTSDEQLAAFITSQPDRVLTVVNVSLLRWVLCLGACSHPAQPQAGCVVRAGWLLRCAAVLAATALPTTDLAPRPRQLSPPAPCAWPSTRHLSLTCSAAPCVHIFPAVLALATNFQVAAGEWMHSCVCVTGCQLLLCDLRLSPAMAEGQEGTSPPNLASRLVASCPDRLPASHPHTRQGYAAFARLLGDDQPELLKKLGVTQVGG